MAGPSHGTVTLNADGSFTYTPAANYNGLGQLHLPGQDGSGPSSDRDGDDRDRADGGSAGGA